jgi:maleylpyruvate isomerase
MTQVETPADLLAAVRSSTDRVLDSVGRLDPADVPGPSLLPGWSRGHVITHLARNADSLVNLLTWARTGDETPQYASPEQRNADIEAGAGRPLDEQRADLEHASASFEDAAAALPGDRWSALVRFRTGRPVPAAHVPWARLRELEIHYVDLDAGYTPAHWEAEFVRRLLDEQAVALTRRGDFPAVRLRADDLPRTWEIGTGGPVVTGPAAGLAAWLIGRSNGDGLTRQPTGALPELPPWT